jgi:hypothetical protein
MRYYLKWVRQISKPDLDDNMTNFHSGIDSGLPLATYTRKQEKCQVFATNARVLISDKAMITTVALHKKIIALATIISVAATMILCSNLRELPTYCSTIKGDIKPLHSYFNTNYMQIIAPGATVDDPIIILFSAYMVVPCHNFRGYIKRKHVAYTDGTLTLTHEELIMLATNKFNLLKQEGTWGAKTPGKDKIVAMQAKLTALKGQFQLAPNLKRAAGEKEDDKAGNKKQVGGNNKKKKNKKNNANKKEQKKDEEEG